MTLFMRPLICKRATSKTTMNFFIIEVFLLYYPFFFVFFSFFWQSKQPESKTKNPLRSNCKINFLYSKKKNFFPFFKRKKKHFSFFFLPHELIELGSQQGP